MNIETDILIRGVRKQNKQAQQRVLQLYGEMVFGQVARIVTCQEDAEEVYQDVFIKVFRSIESYDSRQASLATWISRIAYHESQLCTAQQTTDHLRRRPRCRPR